MNSEDNTEPKSILDTSKNSTSKSAKRSPLSDQEEEIVIEKVLLKRPQKNSNRQETNSENQQTNLKRNTFRKSVQFLIPGRSSNSLNTADNTAAAIQNLNFTSRPSSINLLASKEDNSNQTKKEETKLAISSSPTIGKNLLQAIDLKNKGPIKKFPASTNKATPIVQRLPLNQIVGKETNKKVASQLVPPVTSGTNRGREKGGAEPSPTEKQLEVYKNFSRISDDFTEYENNFLVNPLLFQFKSNVLDEEPISFANKFKGPIDQKRRELPKRAPHEADIEDIASLEKNDCSTVRNDQQNRPLAKIPSSRITAYFIVSNKNKKNQFEQESKCC